ncbi:MAG: PaaI family thioesterase [Paracoccaceae bacterium]
MTPADAQSFLNENFARWVLDLDLTVEEIAATHVLTSMPLTEKLARVGGIVSGQALAAMADTTMVLATAGHFGEFRPVATTNLDTQFLRPGTGDSITCRAEIVRAGKALVFTRAEMVAQPSGKAVASATATFYVP